MMKLTKTMWKAYATLIMLNALIFFTALQIHSYFLQHNRIPINPRAVKNLVTLVNQLQKNPQERWSYILQNVGTPFSISLSTKPLYKKQTFLTLNSFVVFNTLKQNHQLNISVFVNKNTWLNIEMLPPFSLEPRIFMGLLILLFLFFLIVNFLIIKSLHHPFEMIVQSLEDTELQKNWTPIPVTGNLEQQTILKKINALQKRLHKLLSNRTYLVAAISHDLRTPLTRLKLRTENLSNTQNVQKMTNDIQEMEMMIRDTLDYFQDIHHTEQWQSFDFVALLNSIKEDALDAKQLVSFSTNLDKLVYKGAVNLLKRALLNIINNAVHYGGGTRITLVQMKKVIQVTIIDKGPGLSTDSLEKVFMPFYRVDQSRSRETGGTGLGLTIAKEIIEMHYGAIHIDNHEGGGLEVKISLPM